MKHYLLDTDSIIDYLAGIKSSVLLIQKLHDQGNLLCVSEVVVAEIYSGLKPDNLGGANKLLFACHFLPTSLEDAKRAGTWRYNFARRGITLSTSDVLIASTAFANKAIIITGNTDDYPMKGVSVLPLPR